LNTVSTSVSVRSIVEIAIMAAPLAAHLAAGLGAIHFEYWWIALLLAVPAAGFLVRLFMIQRDCGHGSFFRYRAANVGVNLADDNDSS
jgi:acyl-lipid omega-6 desaturase (Delta-12 desaturase)